jgi:hypothetical protein
MGIAGGRCGDESASSKSGSFFLVEERSPDFTYEMFGEQVASGKYGFVITRDFPSDVRRKHALPACPTLWVTNLVGPDKYQPDLDRSPPIENHHLFRKESSCGSSARRD